MKKTTRKESVMTYKKLALLSVLFCFFAAPYCTGTEAPTDDRIHYMGTSIFSLPTGFTRSSASYINDDGQSKFLLTQSVWHGAIELGLLRHTSGDYDSKNILNAKLKLIEGDEFFPSIVWGMSDINTQLGSRITYFAGSKSFDYFGTTLHGGVYRDPVTTDREYFWGAEKMVFPLIIVGFERFKDVNTFGVKLSPYPGLSVELALRDGNEEIYNLNYFRYF